MSELSLECRAVDHRVYDHPSRFFHGAVWPLLSAAVPPVLIDRISAYLKIRKELKPTARGVTVELGGGALPFHRLYSDGDLVVVDWQKHLLEVNKQLSGILRPGSKPNPNFIVADNRHMPFIDGAFENVVSANGYEHNAESLRVLKRGGKRICIWG